MSEVISDSGVDYRIENKAPQLEEVSVSKLGELATIDSMHTLIDELGVSTIELGVPTNTDRLMKDTTQSCADPDDH